MIKHEDAMRMIQRIKKQQNTIGTGTLLDSLQQIYKWASLADEALRRDDCETAAGCVAVVKMLTGLQRGV